MKPGLFKQEEFFERYEFACRFMLALSGVQPLTYGEFLGVVDDRPSPSVELGYTPSAGYPELREAIAAMYANAEAANVMVTVGAIEALMIATNLIMRPGDEVVCLWPSYQPLHEIASAVEGNVRFVALEEKTNFHIDLERILDAVSDRTRLVVLNIPNNPTGATLTEVQLRDLAAMLEPRGVYVLVDEIFREMRPEHCPSAWNGMPNLIVVGSLSKAYGLPGLRIGWLLASAEFAVEARRFRKYTSLNPGALDQHWALCALANREALLARTHRLVSEGLELALSWFGERCDDFALVPPQGGALLFPRLLSGEPTREFCVRVVEATGVLLAPGSDCYESEGFLRVGCATPQLADGLERLSEYMAQ